MRTWWSRTALLGRVSAGTDSAFDLVLKLFDPQRIADPDKPREWHQHAQELTRAAATWTADGGFRLPTSVGYTLGPPSVLTRYIEGIDLTTMINVAREASPERAPIGLRKAVRSIGAGLGSFHSAGIATDKAERLAVADLQAVVRRYGLSSRRREMNAATCPVAVRFGDVGVGNFRIDASGGVWFVDCVSPIGYAPIYVDLGWFLFSLTRTLYFESAATSGRAKRWDAELRTAFLEGYASKGPSALDGDEEDWLLRFHELRRASSDMNRAVLSGHLAGSAPRVAALARRWVDLRRTAAPPHMSTRTVNSDANCSWPVREPCQRLRGRKGHHAVVDVSGVRVLHVIDRLSRAGAETSLRELLPAIQGDGFMHGLVVLWPDRNDFSGLAEVGIPVYVPVKSMTRLGRILHVCRAIRSFRPELVHTSLFEADLAGRVAGLLLRKKVVVSLVNTTYIAFPEGANPLRRMKILLARTIARLLAQRATARFHSVADSVAIAAVAELGVPRDKIHVVQRGRRRERLGEPSVERRHEARRRLGLGSEAKVLMSVGRQEPQKDHLTLVEALAAVRQHHPQAVVVIAGREGTASPALRQRISARGLNDAVLLLGYRADVVDLLCAADVFVFPSRYEGAGGAALEAMALKIPIVASDIASMREVLDGGSCGLLADVGDSESFARAICRVLDAPASVSPRVEAAKERFHSRYTFEASVQGLCDFYRSMITLG